MIFYEDQPCGIKMKIEIDSCRYGGLKTCEGSGCLPCAEEPASKATGVGGILEISLADVIEWYGKMSFPISPVGRVHWADATFHLANEFEIILCLMVRIKTAEDPSAALDNDKGQTDGLVRGPWRSIPKANNLMLFLNKLGQTSTGAFLKMDDLYKKASIRRTERCAIPNAQDSALNRTSNRFHKRPAPSTLEIPHSVRLLKRSFE